MAFIDATERQKIAAAIAEVERHTDAELVTVLAARSDDYGYVPLVCAALIALLIGVGFLFFTATVVIVVTAQLGAFCVLAFVLQIPAIAMQLVPRDVRHWRARNMARSQFLELGLHHTERDVGFLIFVSEAEHYVEILADRGISAHVSDAQWEKIVADFVEDVRSGRVCDGFLRTIAECGKVLAEVVPKTPGNRNELDDRLVLIGYER